MRNREEFLLHEGQSLRTTYGCGLPAPEGEDAPRSLSPGPPRPLLGPTAPTRRRLLDRTARGSRSLNGLRRGLAQHERVTTLDREQNCVECTNTEQQKQKQKQKQKQSRTMAKQRRFDLSGTWKLEETEGIDGFLIDAGMGARPPSSAARAVCF
jgi:hypothetical protein